MRDWFAGRNPVAGGQVDQVTAQGGAAGHGVVTRARVHAARSRLWVITSHPSHAQSARLAILACPNERPACGVLDGAQRRVDVDERALADAGQQRHPLPERHQMRPTYRGELVGVAEGELAQRDP